MAFEFSTSYLADSLAIFRSYKKLAERAMAQVADEDLFYAKDEECNSIAIIVKHMAGNMRSRWTDFLTADGEKPNRNRDNEFEDAPKSRDVLMRMWEEGWACLFGALTPLDESQMEQPVLIRGQAHSVMQAINRQSCHYSYHVGQIVMLAKERRKAEWVSLSVPRGKSAEINKRMMNQETSQR
jgi:hypothetical protein